jgi:NADP-dependent 3-hydroxy acid dehydrogenase YdfG
MVRPISEQVIVITGASSGVGRACVRAFAEHGARLALLARSPDGLAGAEREAREAGADVLARHVDVSDSGAVQAAADAVVQRFGRIDTWVNNAMVSVFSPVKEMKPDEYKRVTDVTYLGYVYGTMAALNHMLPRDEGHIIQIGSALVYRSIPLQSAYCGAKAAIRGFTDSLRTELLHDGSHVDVSMIQLPAVNTPQFHVVRSRLPNHPQPVPPIYQPEVIARAVLHVAEHPTRELIIGFSALKAILGQKFVPSLLDHYLAKNGIAAQQANYPVEPNRPDNLFEPVPGDHGAHGEFDPRSRDSSPELWLRLHRLPVAAAAGAIAVLGLIALRRE